MRIKKIKAAGWKSYDLVEIELSQLNVLVGRNNAGKSALIKAVHCLQSGNYIHRDEIRLGSANASVQYILEDFDAKKYASGPVSSGNVPELKEDGTVAEVLAELRIIRPTVDDQPMAIVKPILRVKDSSFITYPQIPPMEPDNFIYPYLSKRKVPTYEKSVNKQLALQVPGTLQQLSSKVARLLSAGHPGGSQFRSLCSRLLNMDLGTVVVDNGQLVGFTVGQLGDITLESMGEGVAGVLGLIIDLCVADGNLFLIEEPENDIHPQGLKSLLEVIVEKSATNQFIISTHSNIVVKYLASAPESKLYAVEQDINDQGLPTSTVRLVDSPDDRSVVLRDLGYDLHDFDLAEGWLILEEASAERLIRDYLIPWFAPKLTRIRTIGAGGTGDVPPTFREFAKLVLFIHREEMLKHRAWVVVDGDESGREVVDKLKGKYGNWPADRFRFFEKEQFEDYYPSRFTEQKEAAFSQPKGLARQEAKSNLRQAVQDWCDANRDTAREELAESAAEVIAVLQEIEATLFDN
ncbi:ATP-dependent endonuclease [Streptomyces sp. NPDC058420]|uniref:ATP-dependent nuclease n=1 Tax=Streptomyces sp. NPDC058420 TaxID=3346489 RepID=UPI00364B2A79